MYSPVLQELLNSLRCLPGVGPKSAQRMALHLLERDRAGAERLAQALNNAVERIGQLYPKVDLPHELGEHI